VLAGSSMNGAIAGSVLLTSDHGNLEDLTARGHLQPGPRIVDRPARLRETFAAACAI
jgi:hypothetical protein